MILLGFFRELAKVELSGLTGAGPANYDPLISKWYRYCWRNQAGTKAVRVTCAAVEEVGEIALILSDLILLRQPEFPQK